MRHIRFLASSLFAVALFACGSSGDDTATPDAGADAIGPTDGSARDAPPATDASHPADAARPIDGSSPADAPEDARSETDGAMDGAPGNDAAGDAPGNDAASEDAASD